MIRLPYDALQKIRNTSPAGYSSVFVFCYDDGTAEAYGRDAVIFGSRDENTIDEFDTGTKTPVWRSTHAIARERIQRTSLERPWILVVAIEGLNPDA